MVVLKIRTEATYVTISVLIDKVTEEIRNLGNMFTVTEIIESQNLNSALADVKTLEKDTTK